MTLVFTGVITSWGTAFLSRSAIGLGVWPGNAVSTRPAWSAGFDVRIPVSPRVDAEPGRSVRRLAKQVEGEFHVLRADGRAVVPPRSRPQEEDQAAVVVLPRPPLRQFADDRVHPVRGLERIEE